MSESAELEPVESNDTRAVEYGGEPVFTRRQFIASLAAATTISGLAAYRLGSSPEDFARVRNLLFDGEASDSPDKECSILYEEVQLDQTDDKHEIDGDLEFIDHIIAEGILSRWDNLVVFPGLLTVSPEAKIQASPKADSHDISSDIHGSDNSRLVLQRPFLLQSSLDANLQGYSKNDRDMILANKVPDGMVGFFLPNSNNLAFINYNQQREHIQPFSRLHLFQGSDGLFESPDAYGLSIAPIKLDGRREVDNLIYPFVSQRTYDTNPIDECPGEVTFFFKVIGHSIVTSKPTEEVEERFNVGEAPVEIPKVSL